MRQRFVVAETGTTTIPTTTTADQPLLTRGAFGEPLGVCVCVWTVRVNRVRSTLTSPRAQRTPPTQMTVQCYYLYRLQ
jgi:hypothetical protein